MDGGRATDRQRMRNGWCGPPRVRRTSVAHPSSVRRAAAARTADMDDLHHLSPLALAAMASATDALVKGVCENSTNPTTELAWLGLHEEAARLGKLSQDAASAFILARHGSDADTSALETKVAELWASEQRLMFGSWSPSVAAPPSQALLEEVITTVRPAVASFQEASAGTDVLAVVDAAASVFAAAEALRQKYLNGAVEANPHWPGARVGVAAKQVAQASRIHKEVLLSLYGLRTGAVDLQNAIDEFEAAHNQLKDGGGEIAAIIPERQDLLIQWQQVDAAWVAMREEARTVNTEEVSNLAAAVGSLSAELLAAVPLYSIEDVRDPAAFPWPTAIYSGLGASLVLSFCIIVYCQWVRERQVKDKDKTGAGYPAGARHDIVEEV
ncbi:unnamed protein product [Symbiodinium sp. CCMP2592]|nr:unnamed protein product [Symbiodinium sp. CCMP2592]